MGELGRGKDFAGQRVVSKWGNEGKESNKSGGVVEF